MTWEPKNLRHIGDRPIVRPTLCGLVYPGQRHLFSGPPESAKTIAAYAVALEEIRGGGTVALVDFEMGQWNARDRLRELGASDEDLDRLLYYEPETPADRSTAPNVLDRFEPTLAIVDATAGAFRLQGLDDNKRGDVEKFGAMLVDPFFDRGVTTILLDHVVKNRDNRNGFPIGSERKQGIVQVHIGFDAVTKISRGGSGVYKLRVHKDRDGWLRRPNWGELRLRSDPETHAIGWKFVPSEGDDDEPEFRPTVLMERVSVFLERQREPVSRNEVETNVKGKPQYLRQAMDCLAAEGFAIESAGARGARLLASVRPFREADSGPTSSPTSSPGDRDDLVPTSSPEKPPSEAGSRPRPDLVPTSSPGPVATSSPGALSPLGERRDEDEVVEKPQKRQQLPLDGPPSTPSEDEIERLARLSREAQR